MLEERISYLKNQIAVGATAIIFGLVPIVYGCGTGEEKPSKECCESLSNCRLEPGDQVCDGEGDDCYCREKSCCEKLACGHGYFCIVNEWNSDQCKCEYHDPVDKGY